MSHSSNKHFILVNITGGVMGFSPDEIVAFENEYRPISRYVGYWEYFTYVFSDLLDGKEATGFSVLHHDTEAWHQLDQLRHCR